MSMGETSVPGTVRKVAVAVIRGESHVVVAADETVMTVLDAYPDARIVWTHRDPTKVVTSAGRLPRLLERDATMAASP